ncbi:MAG: hypothetical protein RBU29_14605, partial [bacterium]|nr:hypothetical protein [bacterium]
MKQLLFCLVWFVSLGMDGAAFPLTSGHHVAPYEVYRDTFREGRYEEAMRQIDAHIAERADLQESRSFRYMVWCSDRAAILAHIGRTEEAIAAMEEVVAAYSEPVFLWRLANLYETTGHPNEALRILSLLDLQESHRWSFFLPDENLAAVGRIAEVLGEDPKRLLSNFYTVLLRNFPGSAPVLLAAADLASRHNAYDLAEKYLLQILEEDPQHIEALAGLATCYDKASDPRLSAVLESLIQLDPRHFGAIAIQTKNLLDLGDTPAARRLLDIALKINPSHPELNAYQAALHYLEDDLDAMQAIQEKILARNPRGSIAYSIPGKTASRHYRFSDGAAMQEKAVTINPEDTEARTQYALDLLRLGQDDKAKGELERVFAANAYDVQVYNLLNLLDSIHAFERIETDAFILQLPHKETAALHGPMRKLLNEAVAVFEEKYEITLQKPITIQVFDNHDDF